MKVFAKIIFLVVLLFPLFSYRFISDDTAKLQNMLNDGDVTLPAGHVYNVTGLIVTHNLNLNGSTIHLTTNSGAALRVKANNVSITNGTISGNWDISTPGTYDGTSGIVLYKDGTTINKVHVTDFSAYGIVAGPPINKPVITNCYIEKTGVIGFFFDSESQNTIGGIFSNNVVDRSMQPANLVTQPCVAIRGSTSNGIKTSDWTIDKNTLKMPPAPVDWSAECIEIRNINNSTATNNILSGGSIGISVVAGKGIMVSHNKTFRSKLEGIEFAACTSCISRNNSVNGSDQDGILLDGDDGSTNMQIIADTIKNAKEACIHAYKKTKNLTISNCVLTALSHAVNLQNSSFITIKNNNINGNGVAKGAVLLDGCPGNVQINGGSISNFVTGAVTIFSRETGQATDNIIMSGVKVTNTPRGFTSYLEHGALLGKNIIVQ